jgi:hypothetical protein
MTVSSEDAMERLMVFSRESWVGIRRPERAGLRAGGCAACARQFRAGRARSHDSLGNPGVSV